MNHHPRIFISWVQKELAAERRALPLENPQQSGYHDHRQDYQYKEPAP